MIMSLLYPTHQGLQRLLWPSAPEGAAGAARLFRWCGKVGMSSGSQAGGGGGSLRSVSALAHLHIHSHRALSCLAPGSLPKWPCPQTMHPTPKAQPGLTLTQGLLLEVRALQTIPSRGPEWTSDMSRPGGCLAPSVAMPSHPGGNHRSLAPFLGVIHEKEVEQAQACLGEPGEAVFQVVVGLLTQAVLAGQRQLGEPLEAVGHKPGRP